MSHYLPIYGVHGVLSHENLKLLQYEVFLHFDSLEHSQIHLNLKETQDKGKSQVRTVHACTHALRHTAQLLNDWSFRSVHKACAAIEWLVFQIRA